MDRDASQYPFLHVWSLGTYTPQAHARYRDASYAPQTADLLSEAETKLQKLFAQQYLPFAIGSMDDVYSEMFILQVAARRDAIQDLREGLYVLNGEVINEVLLAASDKN